MCHLAKYVDHRELWKTWTSFENAFRNILKEKNENPKKICSILKKNTYYHKREPPLQFGKKCLKFKQTKHLFSLKVRTHDMPRRYKEKYKVLHANSE